MLRARLANEPPPQTYDTRPDYQARSFRTLGLHDWQVKLTIVEDLPLLLDFKERAYLPYSGASAVIVVYDTTNLESFAVARKIVAEVRSFSHLSDISLILVGTKCDRVAERAVQTSDAKEYADSLGLKFAEVSSLAGSQSDFDELLLMVCASHHNIGAVLHVDNQFQLCKPALAAWADRGVDVVAAAEEWQHRLLSRTTT